MFAKLASAVAPIIAACLMGPTTLGQQQHCEAEYDPPVATPLNIGSGSGQCACLSYSWTVIAVSGTTCTSPCTYSVRITFEDCADVQEKECWDVYDLTSGVICWPNVAAPSCCHPAPFDPDGCSYTYVEHWYDLMFVDMVGTTNEIEVECDDTTVLVVITKCPAFQYGSSTYPSCTGGFSAAPWSGTLLSFGVECVGC